MDDGNVVVGESAITEDERKIKRLMLEPENPKASQRAVNAILNADAIILGPGSLYTSVLASLIVPGIKDAVIQSQAVKIYVCNVMTQPGETDGFGAYDHEYFAITPEGDIYPCHQFVGREKYKMGNLATGIVKKDMVQYFRQMHADEATGDVTKKLPVI